MTDRLIRVGRIIAPHGIKGEVKLVAFTSDPASISTYGTLYNETRARAFNIKKIRSAADCSIAVIEGITTRTEAEKLKGIELFANSDTLPKLDNEAIYAHELIGMNVIAPTGSAIGKISGLYDFGAGEVVEIESSDGSSEMYPFNDNTIVMIDRAERKVIFSIPHME